MTLTEVGIITGKGLNVRYAGGRFIASFPSVEIKDGICLRGAYGEGHTKSKAKSDYAVELSGAKIVVNALCHSETRMDLQLPPKITNR